MIMESITQYWFHFTYLTLPTYLTILMDRYRQIHSNTSDTSKSLIWHNYGIQHTILIPLHSPHLPNHTYGKIQTDTFEYIWYIKIPHMTWLWNTEKYCSRHTYLTYPTILFLNITIDRYLKYIWYIKIPHMSWLWNPSYNIDHSSLTSPPEISPSFIPI